MGVAHSMVPNVSTSGFNFLRNVPMPYPWLRYRYRHTVPPPRYQKAVHKCCQWDQGFRKCWWYSWVSPNYLFSSAFKLTSTPLESVPLTSLMARLLVRTEFQPLPTISFHKALSPPSLSVSTSRLPKLVRITFVNGGLFPPMLTLILAINRNGELTFGGTWVLHHLLFDIKY